MSNKGNRGAFMSNKGAYEELETIRDPDGVSAVITERVSTGHLSFRILKEYEDNGEIKSTSYLGRRHLPAIRRILDQLEDRINVYIDQRNMRTAKAVRQGRGGSGG